MIEIKNLVKYYGEKQILHKLNFSVAKGKICGLLGPNGSGKSTTMDILAGLLGPSSGTAEICGFDVVTQSKNVKQKVGYLPDNPPLYREMRVKDFINYAAKIRNINSQDRKKRLNDIMEQCDITDVAHRVIGNLSKGYKQRVALSATLVHNPDVLILDEPTEGLDPTQILQIRSLIKKLALDRTVILSSHILSEVQATCDDVVIINKGKIAANISLTGKESVHKSFLYSFYEKVSEAENWLKEKNFIQSIHIHALKQNTIFIQFKSDFLKENSLEKRLSELTTQLTMAGYPPIMIEQKKEGLDEIFFEVIRSHGSLLSE